MRLVVDNARLPANMGVREQLRLAANTVWSEGAAAAIRRLVRRKRPDVVHFHNTFPQLSPSVYAACAAEDVPVVQTLHNYRSICPAATLFRDGRPCHDCVGRRVAWPGVLHACYHASHARSAVVAAMLGMQRAKGSWRQIDAFIALNEFGRRMFVEGGIPENRIAVKPNFVEGIGEVRGQRRAGFLYVGRLAPEKGIETLLRAWEGLPTAVELRIMGDGPLRDAVAQAASHAPNIVFEGRADRESVLQAMASARALVFPSLWYEGCPVTIIESFASGLPVIASRLGSLAEMVTDGASGLLFPPGDVKELIERVLWTSEHPDQAEVLGRTARGEFEATYTADRSYEQLLEIYRGVA